MKNQKGFSVVESLLSLIIVVVIGSVGWYVAKSRGSTSKTQQSTSKVPISNKASSQCAYIPKQNYPQNEGLYRTSRENAKKIDFDVYLPCNFDKDFNLAELGISGGDSDEVPHVFMRFDHIKQSEQLAGQSFIDIRALPPQHQPPAQCLDKLSASLNARNVRTIPCDKAADSKFGPVYKNKEGDLYITVNNSLIFWTSPPYNDSGNVKPMLDIINSFQKVDPTKLEFYNG